MTAQQTQNICITFVQRRPNGICTTFVQRRPNDFDAGPTLHKCYTHVLCLLRVRYKTIQQAEDLEVDQYIRPLGYERVHLPLCRVADAPFHLQGHDRFNYCWLLAVKQRCRTSDYTSLLYHDRDNIP